MKNKPGIHTPSRKYNFHAFYHTIDMSTGLLPSSPTVPETHDSSSALDKGCTSSYLQNDCLKYHSILDTVHAKIYRYNSFPELIQYLKITLRIHFPRIDYPSNEILLMILTGTQLNHIEEKSSNSLLNLSVPCIEYINALFDIFGSLSTFDDAAQQKIYDEEVSNLYGKLTILFSFLKPPVTSRRSKRKRNNITNTPKVLSLDDSLLDYSMEENMNTLEHELRNDKMQSLFEISTTSDKFNSTDTFFGVKYLPEVERNLWNYFIFAFHIASKLTEIERVDSYESYAETWTRWREFLNIILRFMELELKKSLDITNSLLILNLVKISGSTDFSEMEEDQVLDSLLTFCEYAFTKSRSSCNISSILPLDLTLSQKYNFSNNPPMFEYKFQGSGIGLESLPTRSRLLRICWRYLSRLSIDELVKTKFCSKVAKESLRLNSRELLDFFSDELLLLDTRTVDDDFFFIVSFEVMRLISRTWTITPKLFLEDHKLYLSQLKIFFDSAKSYSDQSLKTKLVKEVENFSSLKSSKEILEKCYILARYQLKMILQSTKLKAEEMQILDGISFNVGNKNICLGDLARGASSN